MATENKFGSINMAGINAADRSFADVTTAQAKVRSFVETVEVDAADDDGSTYRLARVSSRALLFKIDILTDSIAGGTDFDLGFYDTKEKNNGAVILKDALMDGQTLASAGTFDGLSNVVIENVGKKAWELAGLPADPGGEFDIVLTGNTNGTGTGTVSTKIEFTVE